MILATNQDPTSVSMKIIKWLLDPACHAYGYGHDKYDLATNKTTIFQHMMKFWLYIPSFGYGQILVWLVRACIKKKKKTKQPAFLIFLREKLLRATCTEAAR